MRIYSPVGMVAFMEPHAGDYPCRLATDFQKKSTREDELAMSLQ